MLKAYFKIIFALLAVAFVAFGVAVLYYFWQNYLEPSRKARLAIAEIEKTEAKRIDHGAKVYEDAMAQMRRGEMDGARQSLARLMNTYKDSARYEEARRIISEQNLDMLLSSDPMSGKSEYTVKSGDNLIGITSRTKTTMEYLAQVNNVRTTMLRVGQRFVVCALDEFSVVVNLATAKVELRQNDRFFAEYNLAGYLFPSGTPNSFDTAVKGRSAFIDGKTVGFDKPEHAGAEKQIGTARNGVIFRTPPEPTGGPEDAYQYGIFLDRGDIEELYVILRSGAKVHVRQ